MERTTIDRTMRNTDVARIFSRLADLLDIDGANPFRIRAYRNAATTIEALPRSISEMIEEHQNLDELPGIGKDLAHKIEEIVTTGHLSALDDIEKKTPPHLLDLLKVPSLGPKRIHALHEELEVTDLESLIRVAKEGRIQKLTGFGPKTEKKILDDALRIIGDKSAARVTLGSVEPTVAELYELLKSGKFVEDVVVAGSYRRRKETVGDLDILVTCRKTSDVMERLAAYRGIREVLSKGPTRSTVILESGLQVDVRVVPKKSYGAALYYFTGSKEHAIAVRGMAQKLGLKINEYGVFRGKTRVAGATEEEVLASVGLPYIEPELRENRGEIEAALQDELPKLLTINDLKGDLHCHTTASDGRNTLEQMVESARRRNYQYLAITEHSQSLKVAHGLDEKRLLARLDEIDELNESLKGFRVLKGAEVDILEDGRLDYPKSVLERLDIAVCSIHSRFGLSGVQQTERLLRALDNPYCDILGHPTGRLIGSREPYDIDLEKVLEKAKDVGCAVELNSQPDRLDLNDVGCRMAKEIGVKIVVCSDAHGIDGLGLIRFGVDQARRGWLEAKDVLNTLPLSKLLKCLRRS